MSPWVKKEKITALKNDRDDLEGGTRIGANLSIAWPQLFFTDCQDL